MDTIHYVNQWLQYLPLKSENIATVLDNVVRKSQSDILVILNFLSNFQYLQQSRLIKAGQYLQYLQ